jgi:hypothetical protein
MNCANWKVFCTFFFVFLWKQLTNLALASFQFESLHMRIVLKSLFVDAPYTIISLQFCKLGSFYTAQNVFGKHLAILFNIKNKQKLIEL